jgi:hypothetical protein
MTPAEEAQFTYVSEIYVNVKAYRSAFKAKVHQWRGTETSRRVYYIIHEIKACRYMQCAVSEVMKYGNQRLQRKIRNKSAF